MPSTFSGTDNQPVKRTRKQKYRDALDAASKFKERTDYKAEKEAEEKTAAKKATMKIAPDISVMEGYQDPGFTLQGQKGTRGAILGGIGFCCWRLCIRTSWWSDWRSNR